MKIGGLQKLKVSNFPHTLACAVLLSGCNYRCPFCFVSNLVVPEKINQDKGISQKTFFDFLKKNKKELGAVIITGGEPTIHWQLPHFCKSIKSLGYKIRLETNGSNPTMLKSLIEQKLIDYVAMDIKAPKEKYGELIGFKDCSPNYLINNLEKSISLLKENKVDHEFTTTFIPSLLTKEDIVKIAHWLRPAKKYFVKNFQKTNLVSPELMLLNPLPQEQLLKIKQAIAPLFDICEIIR